jgi:Transglutaminase-like domain
MSQFDTLLHREIKDGQEYSDLFQVAKNTPTNLGSGNTFHSIKTMQNWIGQYYNQCSGIAPILKKDTLKNTTTAIYRFLYDHIQYKQDGALQQIRTPANSWANRKAGIDCKSYSVFASCILLCLGIKHYIRQIKQPLYRPNRFTHVYVVVPYNQDTGSLDQGHYVIDATVKSNKEPLFTTKDDTYMEKLPHLGLNGSTRKKRKTATTKRKKPMPRKKKATPRKKATGLGNSLLVGLGAIVGLSQLAK